MSSSACWSWDARTMSVLPDREWGWGHCGYAPDPCTTLAYNPTLPAGLPLSWPAFFVRTALAFADRDPAHVRQLATLHRLLFGQSSDSISRSTGPGMLPCSSS